MTESRLGTGHEHPEPGTPCQTKEQERTECHQDARTSESNLNCNTGSLKEGKLRSDEPSEGDQDYTGNPGPAERGK